VQSEELRRVEGSPTYALRIVVGDAAMIPQHYRYKKNYQKY
jgi:hypothetical protein